MSRRPAPSSGAGREWATADLLTGTGVAQALAGSRAIVHCATSGSAAKEVKATAAVIDAAERAGCPHLVYISIVGVDRIPFPYYKGKLAAEGLVERSRVPSTILRATQFHDLILTVARGMAKLPVIPVPAGFRFQPIDAAEVATRLVELSLDKPAGLVPDLAGPRVYGATELVRGYLRASQRRRLLVPVGLPGQAARAFREGANLAPDRAVGHRTWEDFLAERVRPGE